MPIYEYACKKCGNFEITQRITEEPLKKCPTCGTKVTKLISPSAFHLKGSGWYMTDYGKNGANSGNKTEEPKSSNSETKESKSTGETSASAAKDSPPASKESTPAA